MYLFNFTYSDIRQKLLRSYISKLTPKNNQIEIFNTYFNFFNESYFKKSQYLF